MRPSGCSVWVGGSDAAAVPIAERGGPLHRMAKKDLGAGREAGVGRGGFLVPLTHPTPPGSALLAGGAVPAPGRSRCRFLCSECPLNMRCHRLTVARRAVPRRLIVIISVVMALFLQARRNLEGGWERRKEGVKK